MSDLASQFEKTMMAHAFLERVDQLLTIACAFLVKDPCLAVTAIFQMWLQWFKTTGSGVEWLELATVKKECHQLYEQYQGEEWVRPFDVHFAPVNSFLEFLMDDLMAGMMVSAPAVASASDTAKHPVGALAVVRGEGRKAGPSTPKAAAGGVARGLAMLPQLVTTPRSKGKGKAKARDEEDEDIERKASTVVDTGLGAGVKLEKAKSKVTVLLAKQQEYKCMQGACNNCWAYNDLEGCCEEGEGDVEMRETTPLAIVAEVEQEASNMEVEGEEEFEATPAAIEEDEEEEWAKEVEGIWSDTLLRQVGDDELEWLGKDLGWPTPLMSVALLADFDERAAGVEQQF
ncbi:hypothetical protein J132_00343 [Termitomyces sp. J132]|nr:hypothetical protein J132_00343 [Termitomyces sp. J132]